MARLARVVAPGLPHLVTQRGNSRQPTFFDEGDYRLYLDLLAGNAQRYGLQVWAYCLMPNHVHLIAVPQAQDSLTRALAETHRRYTRDLNLRKGQKGYLWQGRFASFVLDEPYLLAAARYVETNPVRARLVAQPEEWAFSSAGAHLAGQDDRLARTRPLLELAPDWKAFLGDAGEGEAANDVLRRHASTGRPLGGEAFMERLETQLGRVLRKRKPGPKKSRGLMRGAEIEAGNRLRLKA